jgi:cytosine/adenosine deaminase-related metal-dependent hydrolase
LAATGYIDNFFEVMRGAFLIHKRTGATQSDASKAGLRHGDKARRGGARPQRHRRIAPGARRTSSPCWRMHIRPLQREYYDQLVLFRNPDDVKNVFVGGERLKANGRLTRLDQQESANRCAPPACASGRQFDRKVHLV